jgi:hypothetical protein
MYERMLNKAIIPMEDEIEKYIGKKAIENIKTIKNGLEKIFDINMELKFPFGNNYGWGYKISNKRKHLFYIFFEKNRITIMLQINKIKTEKELNFYDKLSEEGKGYWKNKYPCGENGGWIHYRILTKNHIKDIGLFLSIKTGKAIEL